MSKTKLLVHKLSFMVYSPMSKWRKPLKHMRPMLFRACTFFPTPKEIAIINKDWFLQPWHRTLLSGVFCWTVNFHRTITMFETRRTDCTPTHPPQRTMMVSLPAWCTPPNVHRPGCATNASDPTKPIVGTCEAWRSGTCECQFLLELWAWVHLVETTMLLLLLIFVCRPERKIAQSSPNRFNNFIHYAQCFLSFHQTSILTGSVGPEGRRAYRFHWLWMCRDCG